MSISDIHDLIVFERDILVHLVKEDIKSKAEGNQ